MGTGIGFEKHEYPLAGAPRHRYRTLAVLGVLGVGLLLVASKGLSSREQSIRLLGAVVTLGAAGMVGIGGGAAMRLTHRLVLSPEGLTQKLLGQQYFAPWSAVVGVEGRAKYGIDRDVQGFVLRESGKGAGVPLHRRERKFIVITPFFATDWRTGPIGDDLHRWAPHVL
jgi:hypothetical protein